MRWHLPPDLSKRESVITVAVGDLRFRDGIRTGSGVSITRDAIHSTMVALIGPSKRGHVQWVA